MSVNIRIRSTHDDRSKVNRLPYGDSIQLYLIIYQRVPECRRLGIDHPGDLSPWPALCAEPESRKARSSDVKMCVVHKAGRETVTRY